MRFPDRAGAGRRLAEAVAPFVGGRTDGEVVVLGLAPGGLPVAAEIADRLGAPLGATVVRQLNVPGYDRSIGAVANGDPPLLDHDSLRSLGVTWIEIEETLRRERTEIHRREALYREGRAPLRVWGHTVVLVSDGLTDALTARTAVRTLLPDNPARLVLAAPVCDARIAGDLRRDVDALICLHMPAYAHAAGPFYDQFHDVSEHEAVLLLRRQDRHLTGTRGG